MHHFLSFQTFQDKMFSVGDVGADARLFIAMSSSSSVTGGILKGEDAIEDGDGDAPLKITSRPSISLSTGRFQVSVPVIWLMK